MRSNLYTSLTIALMASLSFTSCKKFLDVQPTSTVTSENAYLTGDNIEKAMNGAYNSFIGNGTRPGSNANYYQWEMILQTDIRSDNAHAAGGGEIDFGQIDFNTITNTNDMVRRDWEELYGAISKCNIVIDNVGKVTDPTFSEERRKQILGEASFLRAFHYYQLVKLYGGVPLEKHSNSTDPEVIRIKRSTVEEVYDFIDSDLQVAVNNLPDGFGQPSIDKVRATKGAANALLTKIWAQRPDRDYNKVLQYANAVINGKGGYQLLQNYADLFDGAHNYNNESIIEIPYVAGSPNLSCWGGAFFFPDLDGNGLINENEWRRYGTPSKDLVDAYDKAGDTKRKNANIWFFSVPWADEFWNPCADGNTKIPFNVKQKHANSFQSGDHFYLLRLADIVLLKAEALNALGNSNEAMNTLNIIRHRAGLPDITTGNASQLKSIILNERRLELAFEGQRWDDLNRYGVTVDVMNKLNELKFTCNEGNVSIPTPIKYNFNQNSLLLPIPLLEMQANPSLTQNPGY
ncbi:RagB/SusD family nutrient uptake outer membrane protein [Sphingobacterium sp. GVS05A]|uniref:RagB/SusD family nutrient uptake outer membrane protein n=1 Tax=Sphingobacterium TaxID=28453 RepID=UPI001CBD4D37|nr:RagB/SusD family nutrient uptake outer membrane protein [Sphingobacterium sp. GVS05A]